MAKLYNLARMTTGTTGTGTITLGSAVSPYLSFASAGVSNSDIVTYAINDGANSEIGRGVYTSSGTTLTRNVIKSTNSNNAINLSGSAQVFLTFSAEDLQDLTFDTINIRSMSATPLVERTTYGTGTDITPLINAAGDLLHTRSGTGRGTIIIPAGKWRMASGFDDNVAGCRIVGAGSQATQIFFDATTGIMCRFDGENTNVGWSGGGIERVRLTLGAAALTGSPICIYLVGVTVGGDVSMPDEFQLHDVYINAETPDTARWVWGVYVYGNARTSPPGIRAGNVSNLHVFDCSSIGALFSAIDQWDIRNVSINTGVTGGMDFYLTGGGTSTTNSNQVSIMNLVVGGTLQVNNCSDVFILAKCNAAVTSGATYCRGWIHSGSALSGTFGTGSDVTVHT